MRRASDKLAVVCAALCILCAVVVVGVVAPTTLDTSRLTKENAERTREVEALAREQVRQRRDSLRLSCRREKQQNGAILAFLRDLPRSSPETLERAERFFPTSRDCRAEALERTTP